MINNKDIQENGKLICEFMELRTIDKRAKKNPQFHIPFSTIVGVDDNYGHPCLEQETYVRASDTLFHESWDWLMEVVEKIEGLYETEELYGQVFDISTTHIKITKHLPGPKYHKPIIIDLKLTPMKKIEATYKSVVKFIQWYQKNKI